MNALFVDDEKLPEWFNLPKDTPHAKSSGDAFNMWMNGNYTTLYLDHDLGIGLDGKELLDKIIRNERRPEKVICISLNIWGVSRIRDLCKDYDIPFEDIGRKILFNKFAIDGQSG